MKKLLFLPLIIFLLSSCTTKNNTATDKLNIITTVFPAYDFTRQITGDAVDIDILVPPGAEIHTYEPTPNDIIRINNADIFIFTGGESDEWIEDILEETKNKNLTVIPMIASVDDLISLSDDEHHEHENDLSDKLDSFFDKDFDDYDDHLWTSPKNAIKIVQSINSVLCEKSPQNADLFKKNATNYITKLMSLDAQFSNIISNSKRKTLIFADRFPLAYFARDYGLEYFSAYSGCSENIQVSPATVTFLIDKIKSEKIPAVFYIELSDQKLADTICSETGAKKLLFNTCHTVSDYNSTYISLMEQNLKSLEEALN